MFFIVYEYETINWYFSKLLLKVILWLDISFVLTPPEFLTDLRAIISKSIVKTNLSMGLFLMDRRTDRPLDRWTGRQVGWLKTISRYILP